MLNKRFIAVITLATSLLSLYYINFSRVCRDIERKAAEYATTDGKVDFQKKQNYLIKKWQKPVYRLFGKAYTYEEVKSKEIAMGPDLKHGMHITLHIYAPDVIKEFAGSYKDDSFFKKILRNAEKKYKANPQKSYVKHFYDVYKNMMPGRELNTIFFNNVTEGELSPDATDDTIIAFLEKSIDKETKRSLEVYRKRLGNSGLGSLTLRLAPIPGMIELEIQGITSTKRVKKLIESKAELIFADTENDMNKLNEVWDRLKSATKTIKGKKLNELIQPSEGIFVCKAENIKIVRKMLRSDEVADLLPPCYMLLTDAKPFRQNKDFYPIYLINMGRNGKGLLPGEVINKAYHTFDNGKPQVVMQMNGQGTKAWREITRTHISKVIAIIMDNVVISAPTVTTEIPNGTSVISADDSTLDDVKDLATMLGSGTLAAAFTITGETITGPTLGQEAQNKAWWTFILVLLLIIFFMMFYYASGGIVANLGLLFNMLFILGTLAQLNAALTLAGIAGILLTFGMSVDANVLIFERIREELKRGVYLKSAIDQGYSRAYSSIIDSNLTTLLTGVILYILGQGPIKGFATTLIIGIISSLFTAVLVTRLIIETVGPHRFSFGFSFTKNLFNNLNINFFAIRKKAYLFSFTIITLGMGCIYYNGLQLGVDFTGGKSYVLRFDKPVALEKVKTGLSEAFDHASIEVKTYGSNNVIKVTTSYRMKDHSLESDKKSKEELLKNIEILTGKQHVENAGKKMAPSTFTLESTMTVGAAIADYVMMMAIYAILLALLMIFGYILIRFRRWQFGLAAVLALTHDTLMIFAALGIARLFGITYEIDQVFVGAVLTVIGYSINDTVVVFDRLREKLKTKGGYDFMEIANRSVNETMSRTLITSFTTLLAIVPLFLFAGEALRGFSFTLLVGVFFGTCSSVFAAMLSYDLQNLFGKVWNKLNAKGKTTKR